MIHVAPTEHAAQVEENIEGADEGKPGFKLLDPASVAPVRNGPAVSMEAEDLQTVHHDQLAVVNPRGKEENVNGEVQQKRKISHIVVPEQYAAHVEGVISVSVRVIPSLEVGIISTVAPLTSIRLLITTRFVGLVGIFGAAILSVTAILLKH